jgi:hypothetical protein
MGKKEAEEMGARLGLMKSRIAALQERLQTAEGEVRTELEKRLETACSQQQAECRKLKELKDAGFEKWGAVKGQAEKAWQELEQTLEEIASRLKQ